MEIDFDWYDYYADEALTDPIVPTTGSYRVLRGGSWYITATNVRVSYRNFNTPSYRDYGLGFRLAWLAVRNNRSVE